MELDRFISESLVGIAKGIKDAQEKYDKIGGQVNPKDSQYLNPDITAIQHKPTSRIGQVVEFDLSIRESSTNDKLGKAGIEVFDAVSILSGKIQKSTASGYANKIRFKIPVIFPKSYYKE